jgi:hypothetical protein
MKSENWDMLINNDVIPSINDDGWAIGEEHEIWKLKYQMEYYRNCITDESRNKMQQVISKLETNR